MSLSVFCIEIFNFSVDIHIWSLCFCSMNGMVSGYLSARGPDESAKCSVTKGKIILLPKFSLFTSSMFLKYFSFFIFTVIYFMDQLARGFFFLLFYFYFSALQFFFVKLFENRYIFSLFFPSCFSHQSSFPSAQRLPRFSPVSASKQ